MMRQIFDAIGNRVLFGVFHGKFQSESRITFIKCSVFHRLFKIFLEFHTIWLQKLRNSVMTHQLAYHAMATGEDRSRESLQLVGGKHRLFPCELTSKPNHRVDQSSPMNA